MNKYKLICMAPDGESVTNSEHESIESAQNESGNMGSRWFFYPFHFVVKNETIVSAGGQFVNKDGTLFMEKIFKRKRIRTAKKAFRRAQKYCEKNNYLYVDDFELVLIDQNI